MTAEAGVRSSREKPAVCRHLTSAAPPGRRIEGGLESVGEYQSRDVDTGAD